MLWANIIDFVNDVWPLIQVIFKQTDLVKVAIKAIDKVREEMGDKPEETNQLIKILNSKNMYHLDEMGIEDRIGTIIEINKILTKRNLILNAKASKLILIDL